MKIAEVKRFIFSLLRTRRFRNSKTLRFKTWEHFTLESIREKVNYYLDYKVSGK